MNSLRADAGSCVACSAAQSASASYLRETAFSIGAATRLSSSEREQRER